MSRILVGTCNWADHAAFYPKGVKPAERIGYYADYFPIVEVDASFYRIMPPHNYELWAERTPDDFVFNVKAYRTLTRHGERFEPGKRHETDAPELDPTDEDFRLFKESIQPLKDAGKLRAVHFQFPPWFKASDRNKQYLDVVREYLPDDLVAVEFRHKSWLEGDQLDRTMAKLAELGLVYTAVDQPQLGSGSIPPVAEVTNPALSIVRFHGRDYKSWYKKDATTSADRFDYLYSKDELAEWVPAIERLAKAANEVHVLMNNNRGNYAVVNARDVQQLLGQQPKLPEIEPSEGPAKPPKQPKLPLGA
jgi:uncharacterized protein YecE (DUF72 family)